MATTKSHSRTHPVRSNRPMHSNRPVHGTRPVHSARRPVALWLVAAILVFIGAGALLPGYAMITDPTGATLGMADQLESPLFTSFLIPGLFLFLVLGIGTIVSALLLILRPNWQSLQALNPVRSMAWHWVLALLMGIAVILWISIQVLSVRDFSWLQPLFFGLGIAIVLLLFTPALRQYFTLPKIR